MATQITLPPNRLVLQGNPPADIDAVVVALLAMGAVTWITPTGDSTGVADTANLNAALAALPAAGGTVRLSPGKFYITCGSVVVSSNTGNTFIRGSGRWATIISAVGTGDTLRFYQTNVPNIVASGGLLDFTIDGTNAGAGSVGLHYGDLRAGELRIGIQNFSGTGSIGAYMDNHYAFTEETHGYLWLSNNTQNIVFDVTGSGSSYNSFGYSDLHVEILAKVNQDGVVLQNGALLYNSEFTVRANFQSTSLTATNAVLRITGQIPAGHPNAGSYAAIHSCRLDIMAECNNSGANSPQTINYGTPGQNSILGCVGILDFAQGLQAFVATNWTALGAGGTFGFMGVVRGDFNLNNAAVGAASSYSFAVTGPLGYGKALLNNANGNLDTFNGDFFQQTLISNTTINLNSGGAATLGCAQRKTIIIKQAAAGGPFTVTWPHTGSPTVTACTVNWAGGTAPTMSAGANAVDVYHLVTYDGATWYGRADQNMS